MDGGTDPPTADGVDPGGDTARGAPWDGAVDTGPTGCVEDAECNDFDPCNGTEQCKGGECVDGEPASDGTRCDLDHDPGTPDLCFSGRCQASRCGDRWVDSDAGEQCDDGNHDPADGCRNCQYGCESNADCGACSECDREKHRCMPVADGESCGDDASCASGVCLPKSCDTDSDCDDGNPCNGAEKCFGGACVLGEALDCSDGDPCTEDVCDPEIGGCAHYMWDFDLDGHAPSELGECGTDCDDEHAGVYLGAPEACDMLDNDCDGVVDEGEAVTWWVDCDGDGYAATDAAKRDSCEMPSTFETGCRRPGATWTTRAPSFGPATDCNDDDARVNPSQTTYQSDPIDDADEGAEFDYNCDGVEDAILTRAQGSCMLEGSSCVMEPGWFDHRDCGESGLMLARCRRVFLPSGEVDCMKIPETPLHVQRCL